MTTEQRNTVAMEEFVHTLLLLQEIQEEEEELGDDFQIFDEAPEMPEELTRGFVATENHCSCLACVHLRAAAGHGVN